MIKKKSVVNILIFIFTFAVLVNAAAAAELISVKGTVKSFANPKHSKTISVDIEDKGVMVFKYSDDTVFKNFRSLPELKEETVAIKYRSVGPDRIAAVIVKSLVTIPDGVSVIETSEMADLIKKGPAAERYFLIDTRPSKRYEEGHLPGAVSIPVSELKEKGPELLPPVKEIPLIFYGGGPTCGMSPLAAELSLKWNFSNIRIYLPGEPAWTKAGNFTISTHEFIKESNVLLIDLRTKEAVEAGHIPGAVSIPADKLLGAQSRLPAYKGADIVFYGKSVDDLISAVKTAHNWGYRKSTIFLGGTDVWELVGYDLVKGPAPTEITYKRIIPQGEISIQDFKDALSSGNTVLVDVRNVSEYATGHIPRAVNIPIDLITSRYTELPKDKTILAYCVTGVRAEMAYTILKEHGYDVKFLNAAPVFNEDGSYSIDE